MDFESLDLVVIGAGWSGLSALKTYRQIHPAATTCLLESASSVGGVWARDRLWDGLKANNMRGTYEYSDFPMDDSFGVKAGEHIPGQVVQRYLERYCEEFKLMASIRCGAKVTVVEHVEEDANNDNGNGNGVEFPWKINYTKDSAEKVVQARKLILATGITSQPYLPALPGADSFARPVFHSSAMPLYHKSVVTNPSSRIAVYGATKSAWDAVYAAATAGASVDWIIRDNGHGPCWMSPPYVTPLQRWLEKLVTTRLLTWFSPCIWSDAQAEGAGGTRLRRFLHATWLGRKVVDTFWSILGNDVVTLNKFDSHPETKKLKPWISAFWVASGLSILNYPTNFFDLVTKTDKVRIHTDHITSLAENGTIHLANSPDLLNIDALIVASGWKPTPEIDIRPKNLPSQLGYPSAPDPLPASLISAADAEILRRFPRLKTRPVVARPGAATYAPLAEDAQSETQALHPYRLTRFIVPVDGKLARERSVAFVGVPMTINTALVAQTQALWVAAFLSGRLALESIATETCPDAVAAVLEKTAGAADSGSGSAGANNVLWETALHTQFGFHRYPGGLGKRNPDFVFDAIPYVDVLLRDLGVGRVRKESSGWKRFIEPCGVEDYVGVLGEWAAKEGIKVEV
ncbi:hypothetical protein BJY01DRAFT_241271 [Aspergillus pseudoustus]|uniref:FAD/NAD(P)-binding domain-containing protein n=1 Tax=Aspergillus pseudoustus TaxID=1810923 RepID=A0ABR4IGM5_9EURO